MPAWYAEFRLPILLLQSVVGVFVFAYSLRKRRRFPLRLVLGTSAGFAVLHGLRIVFFPDIGQRVNSPGRIVMTFAVYLVLILLCWLFFEESFWTALFVAASGYIAQDLGGTVKTLLKLDPWVDRLCQDDLGILLVDLAAYFGMYAALYLAFRPFTRSREENFNNRMKAVFSTMVLAFGLGLARITQGNTGRNETAVFAESVYQLLCGTYILLLQFGVMERAKLSRSVEDMRELVHLQREQFRQSEESAALVNEKYHDLKGLLENFQGQISQEQTDQIKQKVEKYDTFVDTGNRVLDIVLAEKRAACARRGIELTAFADGGALDFIEELDLYALVSNALNNAVDAVVELPEGERFIILTASAEGDMATIHVENPYTGDIAMEGGLPKSRRDARYHGFGVKSMKRTVEKYGGTLAVTLNHGKFLLDLILFRP